MEATLSYAEVIDVSKLQAGSRIVFGAIVDLEDEESGDKVTYQIVGDLEADIKQRLIAVSSPIARALIGKSQGDSFEFQAPNGVKRYEVMAVRYD
jgi:transcription elongation factor GreA